MKLRGIKKTGRRKMAGLLTLIKKGQRCNLPLIKKGERVFRIAEQDDETKTL